MFKNLNPSLLGVSGHQSEIIELALTYGFRGMDLDIVEFTLRANKHGMPYAMRLLGSANLQVGCFQLPLEWDADDDLFKHGLAELAGYAKAAAEAGCSRCVALIQPAGDQRPYHENFEFHRFRFTDICKTLQPFGVRLGIGIRAADDLRKERAFQFIHEMEALSLLVKMIDASNVGLLVDTWDVHVSGGSPDTVRGFSAEQIVAVRVADLPEDAPDDQLTEKWRHLPSPEGRVGVPDYLKALAELGYAGPLTPAPARKTLQGLRRDEAVRKAGKALDEARQAAGLNADGKPAAPAKS
jgi:sugar phosphate isomerase/epimerase